VRVILHPVSGSLILLANLLALQGLVMDILGGTLIFYDRKSKI